MSDAVAVKAPGETIQHICSGARVGQGYLTWCGRLLPLGEMRLVSDLDFLLTDIWCNECFAMWMKERPPSPKEVIGE